MLIFFFFSSRRRHTRSLRDWSSDVCSSDLSEVIGPGVACECIEAQSGLHVNEDHFLVETLDLDTGRPTAPGVPGELTFTTPTKQALPLLRYRTGDVATLDRGPDRKSTRLNS